MIAHEDAIVQSFKEDPDFAAEYLNAVLADGDSGELETALKRLALAAELKDISENANQHACRLFGCLSPKGNAELASLLDLLRTLKLRLAVLPIK